MTPSPRRRPSGLTLAAALSLPAVALALALAFFARAAPAKDAWHDPAAVVLMIAGLGVVALAAGLAHVLALRRLAHLRARRIEDAASIAAMRRELELKAELEARVRELTLLHDTSRALASTLEPDAVPRRLEGLVSNWLPLDRLELRAAEAADRAAGEGKGGSGASGDALELPLLHDGASLGTLVLHRRGQGRFSPAEARLLEAVASQAALALSNARLHQAVLRQSLTDPLTGLANRRALFARLELELERCDRFGEPLGLAILDVDHFKRLNDRFGHPAGDAALREVAAVLGRARRKVDLVARYGGEEFAIVLPGADRAAALRVAEKLRAAVAEMRFECPEGTHGLTISAGVAEAPLDARELSTLIDCADAALFAAKRAGRDRVRAHEAGMREHPGRERDVSITAGLYPPAR